MDPLPILNCDDCGACCMEQGSPPGYILFLTSHMADEWREHEPEDAARWDAAPDEARQIVRDYVEARNFSDGPCIWLDQTIMRCRFYEYRPQICRDLDVGSEGCRCWRDEYNIDVDRLVK